MKKTAILSILVAMMALMSCSNRAPFFEKYYKFEQGNWDRFNKVIFYVPITEPGKSIDLTLIFKPTREFTYSTMPVYLILNSPSGEERMNELKILVKDGEKFVGQVEGKPIEIRTSLWKSLKISDKGTCSISIENMIPKIQTPGISEIGIIAEYSKE